MQTEHHKVFSEKHSSA